MTDQADLLVWGFNRRNREKIRQTLRFFLMRHNTLRLNNNDEVFFPTRKEMEEAYNFHFYGESDADNQNLY